MAGIFDDIFKFRWYLKDRVLTRVQHDPYGNAAGLQR